MLVSRIEVKGGHGVLVCNPIIVGGADQGW